MDILEIVKVVWKDMLATPWGALLGLIILFLVMFREELKGFIQSYTESRVHGVSDKLDYTKQDVIHHPIFRDLEYWITCGIDLVKIEKSYAKELIMKDLLRIKFSVIKDKLLALVNDPALNNYTISELKAIIHDMLRDIDTQRIIGWRNNGIPEIFIKKYVILHQLGKELTYNTIKVFLSEEVGATNYTRIYLILSILEAQLSNIYANAVSTALSLNGDLNGTIYKGVIIGSTSNMYAMDTPIHKELVEDKLRDILIKNYASRASVIMFHDYPGKDPFDGKFSMVYEQCAPGVSEERKAVQYMPCSLLVDYVDSFNNKEMLVKKASELTYGLNRLFLSRGTEMVATYPLKDDSTLKGFISIEWNYYERFKSGVKLDVLNKDLISCAEDIKRLMLGHK